MTEGSPQRTMKTVDTSWEIIHYLADTDGAGVTNIANQLDISKATAHTHLSTLKENKYVIQKGTQYYLSLHFMHLGEYVKNSNDLYLAGKSNVDQLAIKTDEYVHLVTEQHSDLIYLYEAQGENAIAQDYFTKKFERPLALHTSAYGKSILAYLPEQYVEEIIESKGLPKHTKNTITSKRELFEELETIRNQGYALNDEEEILGARAVGAPIFDSDETILGAISVTIPDSRMSDDKFHNTIPDIITSTANIIEINLQTLRDKKNSSQRTIR
jgi:DNA-binding IclR family transcriptional regulator